jgi:hypothetical protein
MTSIYDLCSACLTHRDLHAKQKCLYSPSEFKLLICRTCNTTITIFNLNYLSPDTSVHLDCYNEARLKTPRIP